MVYAHAFAGGLISKAVLSDTKFSKLEKEILSITAIVASILPDLDILFVVLDPKIYHRALASHSILPYTLIAILGLYLAAVLKSKFVKYFTICLFLGAFSHILIDFFFGGVALFSPLVPNLYGIPIEIGKFETRMGWAVAYTTSFYMVIEIVLAFIYLAFYGTYKTKAEKYLPLFFLIIASGFMFGLALLQL